MGGLRERKKAKVREAIAAAALRLFLARGFESTTIDEIADAAEVGRRTVFRYFPSKEDVAFPDYALRLRRFEALLACAGDQPPLARVQHALRGLAAELVLERARVLGWQQVVERSPALLAHERTLDLAWEAAIARALGAGAASVGRQEERRIRLCAGAVFGVIRATLRLWIEGGAKDDLAALGEEALALLERGLAHPDALRQDQPVPPPSPKLQKSAPRTGRKLNPKGR